MTPPTFPDYADSRAKGKIQDLVRLMDVGLHSTQFILSQEAARLIAILFRSYKASLANARWSQDDFLKRCLQEGRRLHLTFAAIFDLVTNIEYCHGRLTSSRWIYCNRQNGDSMRTYYAFLKQCPRCCLDRGLEPRLSGAQHKPSSHHIGEITTTVSALLLKLLTAASDTPLTIAAILKQSHDVDAIGFNDTTLVLFEIKASPLVTYPITSEINAPMFTDDPQGERLEYRQHALIDFPTDNRKLNLFVPHRDWLIPLGQSNHGTWPYPEAQEFFADSDNFLEFLSAWLELYYAYAIPKTQRIGSIETLAYLVNGWGDEIDSNKTKPGLGRTDDLKKGTYQLLKFGTYYRDVKAKLQVRSALVANIDPMFLKGEYLEKLADVRWGKGGDFSEKEEGYYIHSSNLHYLYEGILAFNEPLINDTILEELFDFDKADRRLEQGVLDDLLEQWLNPRPNG